MTSESLLGTETSKMRPVGAGGVARRKAKAEDGRMSWVQLKDRSSWERELQGGER